MARAERTEPEIERLAERAEKGFDLSKWKPKAPPPENVPKHPYRPIPLSDDEISIWLHQVSEAGPINHELHWGNEEMHRLLLTVRRLQEQLKKKEGT